MVLQVTVKCVLFTILSSLLFFGTSYGEPEVTILQGNLLGTTMTTRNNRSISAFLGIPYGQPPIGNLRFANPVAAGAWNGTLNATRDGSVCPQALGSISGSEDCLYLNVYTPQLPVNTSTLLPVMVWIHGGAFLHGSSSSATFSPDYLLDSDIVLALPNYRIGALGFLSTGNEVAAGNWGLKDQILALKWVQNNIEYFGGDPDQVTLFGQSAGSASVHLLSLSKAAEGLFHRYITQSGSALSTWAHLPSAGYASRAFQLGGYVDCDNDTSSALIECLRTVNASDIVASASQFYVWESVPLFVWGPTDEPDIEGAVLTDSPTNLFATGEFCDLPWMTGIVRDEGILMTGALYSDDEKFYDFLDNFDLVLPEMLIWNYQTDSGAAWVKAVKNFYFNDDFTTNSTELLTNLIRLVGDANFIYPTLDGLQQQLPLAVNPQYFYLFNYRGTYSLAAGIPDAVMHTDDVIYLFPLRSILGGDNLTNTDFEMVDNMVQLWTSFAINGTPTVLASEENVTYTEYTTMDNYLRIGNQSEVTLSMEYSLFKERMEFWANLVHAEASAATLRNTSAGTLAPQLICSKLI
ncbi:juvenile hormone esterase-like isoform X2 [Neodiprion lecontei]|uniref:Carboxylic ester hydrolase n=1 Tax=Neodiprion lecontei TaxID=441921 RepID=A0ABM3FGD9_NEOLC|nr:juvenile hormone esterase-like isoform X2 [Neodiprion lecontei]